MSRTSHLIFGLAILLSPALCSAENATVYELRNQTQIDGWNVNNLTSVQLMPQGLTIVTQTDGQVVKATEFNHVVRTIEIDYTSPTGGTGIFFWRTPDMPGTDVYQIPVEFIASRTPQKLLLDVSQIPEWSDASDRVGLLIRSGTQIVLHSMKFSGPGILDKLFYPVKSFFSFDIVRAYTVNFVWGPLMVYNQTQLDQLYSAVPPIGDTWNLRFYGLLLLTLIGVGIAVWRKKAHSYFIFFAVFAGLWILYDIRMGTELISFARHDYVHWWSQPDELKDFRDRGSFTIFSHLAKEYTTNEERYALITPTSWPYEGALLYNTYPAVPVWIDGISAEELSTVTEPLNVWVVFHRRDVTLNEEGQLMMGSTVLSPPGTVLLDFEPGAFIFRVNE